MPCLGRYQGRSRWSRKVGSKSHFFEGHKSVRISKEGRIFFQGFGSGSEYNRETKTEEFLFSGWACPLFNLSDFLFLLFTITRLFSFSLSFYPFIAVVRFPEEV